MRASRSRPARPRRWRLSSAARSTCGRASYATRISPSSDAELGLQLELLAVHSPAVLLAAGLERDLFAAHLAFDRDRALGCRSEERRVGKECRSRRALDR